MSSIADISESVKQRFWSKVETREGCWGWKAGKNKWGYGKFWLAGRTIQAQRVSWLLHFGEIPTDVCVLHQCDNPECVNPSHLFLGTAGDNNRDRARKGRSATGERSGARKHPERWSRGDNHWTHQQPERLLRGQRHGRARLTDSDVLRLLAIVKGNPSINLSILARQFKIGRSTLAHILNGDTWTHIARR